MAHRADTEEPRVIEWRSERVRSAVADKVARMARDETAPAAAPPAGTPAGPSSAAAQAATEAGPRSAAERFLDAATPDPESAAPVGRLGALRAALGHRLFIGVVVAPVILVAIYLLGFATPMYESRSVVAITRSSDAETAAPTGLLGRLENSANLQEVFRADAFIKSQALMDELEADLGLVTEFSGPAIDPVRRLRTIPLLSIAPHDQFDRFVTSSIDVQSGLMTLYVRAPSPGQAEAISAAILRQAEEQVAELGQTLFDTRRSYAADMRAAAEEQVQAAQARLVALQFRHQEVDPKNRIEGIYARIRELEEESQRLKNDIQKTEIDGFGNSPQTERMIALDTHIQEEIKRERAQLVSPDGVSATPLNNLLMEYEMALLEVELARQAVKSAIDAQAEAGREAALNRSLLMVVVPTSTAQTPVFPNIPGTLALCFVICLALYAAIRAFPRARR